MRPNEIIAKPLNSESFRPYGSVIEIKEHNRKIPINQGNTVRHDALATVELACKDDLAIISIFCSEPITTPFIATSMECHPCGSQAFMPLNENPYLVAVAPAGDFDQKSVELFLAQPHQGVNYKRGVWHHYNLPLSGLSHFFVVDRKGAGKNCNEVKLNPPLCFSLEE